MSDIVLNQINDYFANIATDPSYSCEKVIKAALQAPHRPANCKNYPSDRVQIMLARISRTSPVNDNIPYWVYRNCSSELAEVVTRIVNMSVSCGVVPAAWRTAVITPVPKCTPVSGVSDLRPISVISILSRTVERLIVKDHIFHAITSATLYDQFGFKPTGSTTAALVDITNTISIMLKTNKYVRCLLIDFQKHWIQLTT